MTHDPDMDALCAAAAAFNAVTAQFRGERARRCLLDMSK